MKDFKYSEKIVSYLETKTKDTFNNLIENSLLSNLMTEDEKVTIREKVFGVK